MGQKGLNFLSPLAPSRQPLLDEKGKKIFTPYINKKDSFFFPLCGLARCQTL